MRAPLRTLTVAALSGSLLLSACSSSPEPVRSSTAGTTSASSTSTTTSPSPSPTRPPARLTVVGAPAGLVSVVAAKYAGRPVTARANLGTWHGDRVAVVTSGKDVTLAVAPRAGARWVLVGGWWPSLHEPAPQVGGRQFVLAVGSDARQERNQSVSRSRGDAIQLVGRDGKGGGGIVGIPRDSWVPLTTGGTGKINSAMAAGGPAGMTATVAATTGVPVTQYVVMSFLDLIGTVNALGGVPLVSDMSLPAHGIKRGPMVLTGLQALWYARERKSLAAGDFARSAHQGQLMLAAALKARLKGVAWAPHVITVLDKRSTSNLTSTQVLQWAAAFYSLDVSKVGRGVAQGTTGMTDGQSVVHLGSSARALFADLRDGNLSP